MNELQRIDELYKAFCQTLPGMLHAEAQGLAYTLGLAPARDIPWSAVFSHGITLAAPALLAEAMPHVRGTTVQDALLAHMLAVIEAFGADRLEDGQVRQTWQLETLLAHMRRARDHAMRRLAPSEGEAAVDFAVADEVVQEAMQDERRLLLGGAPADFACYQAVARGKQQVGIPASLALAQAAGWDRRLRGALARMLEAVWVGLQLHDDVMDWEEDWVRGRAWAFALARGLRGGAEIPAEAAAPADEASASSTRRRPSTTGAGASAEPEPAPAGGPPSSAIRPAVPAPVRRLVLESGVLVRMLEQASRQFRQARRRAEAFGARRVASWAAAREAQTADLARCEAASPGYASRARALSAWARTVLA